MKVQVVIKVGVAVASHSFSQVISNSFKTFLDKNIISNWQ